MARPRTVEAAAPATGSPNDSYAKYLFRSVKRAKEELAVGLGPSLSALIDWKTLRLEPTELVDQALARRFPDLRFRAKLRGQDVQLDLIFEHQSAIDALMPARFLCHTGAIWNAASQEKRRKMPLVLNVLLHHGSSRWPASLDLWSVIKGGRFYRDHAPEVLPHIPIFIDDLAGVSDEEILARDQSPEVRLGLLALKNARDGKSIQALRRAAPLVKKVSRDVLRETVRYFLEVDSTATVTKVGDVLAVPLGRRGRELAMTAGEKLRAQGQIEGRREERARSILRVLRRRRMKVPAEVRARIEGSTDLRLLTRWLDRAVTAESARNVIED